MDDLVRDGVLLLIGSCLLVILVFAAFILVVLRELQALTEGDAGFILASIGAVVIAAAVYIAIGYWLENTGRI